MKLYQLVARGRLANFSGTESAKSITVYKTAEAALANMPKFREACEDRNKLMALADCWVQQNRDRQKSSAG